LFPPDMGHKAAALAGSSSINRFLWCLPKTTGWHYRPEVRTPFGELPGPCATRLHFAWALLNVPHKGFPCAVFFTSGSAKFTCAEPLSVQNAHNALAPVLSVGSSNPSQKKPRGTNRLSWIRSKRGFSLQSQRPGRHCTP
jgi:hypothetical protein